MKYLTKNFSIVIPTKNSEKYIYNCLNSIYKQKEKSLEIIIVDAFSNDQTLNIVNNFKKKIKNIKIFKFKSRPEAASALGIHRAKGKYIVWLGSDDRLFSVYTLVQVKKTFEKIKCDILYGSHQLIDSKEKVLKTVESQKFDYNKLLNKQNYICATSLYFKNSIFKKIKKNADDGFDYAFILKTSKIFNYYQTKKILSKFMVHEMSHSGNFYKNIVNIILDWKISRRYGGHLFNNWHRRYILIKILSYSKILWIAELFRKLRWKYLLSIKANFKKNSPEVINTYKKYINI